MSDRFHTRLWRNAVMMSAQRKNPTPALKVVEGLRECPSCGLFQCVSYLKPGQVAACGRCNAQLARRRRTAPIAAPAAFCIASAALYLALLISTLMTLNVSGRENTVSLLTGPIELMHEGFGEVGLLVGLVTLIMPGIAIALMGAILVGATREHMPDWTPRFMRWYEALREWSMIEVYILGVFVAYSKLIDLALVSLEPGVYLIAGLMFTMAATDSTLDEEQIWQNRDIEEEMHDARGRRLSVEHVYVHSHGMPPVQHLLSCHACQLVMDFGHTLPREDVVGECPRCQHTLRRRKPFSLSNTAALLIAAIIFYVPANLFPVMTYSKVGHADASTIVNGAIELWQAGLIPLSLLVLFASITVPVLKIVSLATMVTVTRFGWKRHLPFLTKLFRVVDIIGRWSMIDVFMISILVAVVHFNFLANVTANFGCVCFATVVILTIFAVHTFDPRGMWDAAGCNGPIKGPIEDAVRTGDEKIAVHSRPEQNMEPERA